MLRSFRHLVLVAAAALLGPAAALATSVPAAAIQYCTYPDGLHVGIMSGDPLVPGPGNQLMVAAELARTGSGYAQLRARTPGAASGIGSWERFELECLNGPGDIYAIKSLANNAYVSAELGWSGNSYGLLRARATAIGPWEQFHIETLGRTVAFRSEANGLWVSAELGWSGSQYAELRARASAIGPWEQYFLYYIS